MSDLTEKDEKKKKNTALIIVVIVVLLLLIVIAILLFFLLKGKDEPETRGSVRTVESVEQAQEAMDDMQEQVRKGMFECEMAMHWTFPDGKSRSTDAYVGNSEANTYPIYFDVIRTDTDEVIYSSPVIPVGSNIAEFALDKELPKGNYEAKVMYTLIEDVETQKEISQAGFLIDIEVQN